MRGWMQPFTEYQLTHVGSARLPLEFDPFLLAAAPSGGRGRGGDHVPPPLCRLQGYFFEKEQGLSRVHCYPLLDGHQHFAENKPLSRCLPPCANQKRKRLLPYPEGGKSNNATLPFRPHSSLHTDTVIQHACHSLNVTGSESRLNHCLCFRNAI